MKLLRSPIFSILFGILLGLAAGGLVALLSSAPRGTPIQLQPAPTPAPIRVDISGAVQQPGVYSLPAAASVQQAVEAAGGLSGSANREAVNLAVALKDGEKLVIPAVGTPAAPVQPETAAEAPSRAGSVPDAAGSDPAPAESTGPVNLNTATSEQLQTLPGIGPSKAADIIAYREAHGGFKTIEEIQEVKGIGPATFNKLKDKITVD